MRVGPRIGAAMAATARACGRHALSVVLVSVLLAAAGIVYTVHTITFITSNLRLLPQREPYVVLLKEYERDFGELNDIVVVVESPSPDRAKAYAARLDHDLVSGGLTPSRVTYRVDPAYFDGRALLYLSVDDLTALRDRLFDYQEFIEAYAAHHTLPQLLEGLNRQIANAVALGFLDLGLGGTRSSDARSNDLRFLEAVIDQISARLDGSSAYASPWSSAFSGGRLDDPDAGYFFSSDKHWLFMFVRQRRDEGSFVSNRATIDGIRGAIAHLKGDFPEVRAGVTGGPVISNDEMATAFADSKIATVLAFASTMALLLLAFRRVVKPVLMLVALAVSLGWSVGIIALVVGHLSIFSVMFISIVVGIGIDYGIYLLYRYEEEWWQRPGVEALGRSAERAGPGMFVSGLAAIGAFAVLMLTDFQGIREFGFVAGIAVLMAFLAMITLLPALLALVDRGRPHAAARGRSAAVPAHWLERLIQPRRAIMIGALVLTTFSIWGAIRVQFDYNMLKLQARGVESVAWEELILAKAGRSGFAALATASNLDELRRKRDAFAALSSVAKVESALMLVPDHQDEKTKLIKQFAPLLASVRVASASPLSPRDLRAPLETLERRLTVIMNEGSDKARREVAPVRAKLEALIDKLSRSDPQVIAPGLVDLERQLALDFAEKLTTFQKNLVPQPVKPGDVPPEIRHRYIGTSGRYLLRIHPAVDIWDQAGAQRFVTDLRSVDRDVTGPPITSFEAIRFIRHGYFQGTLWALALVIVVTAVILRTARGTALALIPLGLGVLWTLGFMHVFKLEFNLANVWALPLIIGTAAEFGLNIFVRFEEGRETGGPTLGQSTVMAVVLNGFTTMTGFGSLMVAHHRGIFGLGLLLAVGMIASLIASLAVLPALLRILYGSEAVASAAARSRIDDAAESA
jgi:hypothetical protein